VQVAPDKVVVKTVQSILFRLISSIVSLYLGKSGLGFEKLIGVQHSNKQGQ